jgi:putative Holliday junction resolvase
MTPSSTASSAPPTEPLRGRILAIDYGRKRFGLALSDEHCIVAAPLTTLPRTNRRDDLRRLRLLARENGVRCIVVGLPLRLDGTTGDMAEEVKRFAIRLNQNLGIRVEMMDERLTSWEAGEIELEVARGKKSDGHRDDIAAALILRDYLATLGSARGPG